MIGIYLALGVIVAAFLIGSYSAIVNGTTWGSWVTGICLWIIFMIVGIAMFK